MIFAGHRCSVMSAVQKRNTFRQPEQRFVRLQTEVGKLNGRRFLLNDYIDVFLPQTLEKLGS